MTCAACRTIPTVISNDYEVQGAYETIAGLKTYVTGPKSAKGGIVNIFDIFGFSSQTLQGADILATRTKSIVVVPDFFHGDRVKHDWLPANTDEKKTLLSKFMSEKASFPPNVKALLRVVEDSKAKFPTAEKWAAFGLCWGGKIAVLASVHNTPFVVSGQTHPGRLDKADAEKLTIPHIVLASKDEPADVVAAYADIIKKNGKGGLVETYPTMWHGWMGARANLEQEDSRGEYARGYEQVAEFMELYLK